MLDKINNKFLKNQTDEEKTTALEAIKIVKSLRADIGPKEIFEKMELLHIISSLKAGKEAIACGVLSLANPPESLVQEKFGKETALLFESEKKFRQTIERYEEASNQNPEIKKVLFFSLTKNIKLLLLVLAKEFMELRHLEKKPKEKAEKLAAEAREIIIPLIHKLGIKKIMSKTEDAVFRFTDKKKFSEINEKIQEIRKKHDEELTKMKKTIVQKAREQKIKVQASYRVKGIYSTCMKMARSGKKLEDIHDIIAIRIITGSVKECYELLGIVHSTWVPFTEEFDDYIAKPKGANYRSLHTTIISREQTPIEIQIRTKEMHDEAELGIAAHWKYKGETEQKNFDKKISWLNEFLAWQETKPAETDVKINFLGGKTYAITPKGKIVELPDKATVLDFAYIIHSDLGEHCVKGKINGVIAPIDQTVENFDVVEIITSPSQKPKVSWLNIVKSENAKIKIKRALNLTQTSKKQKIARKKGGIKSTDKRIKLGQCCKPVPGDEVVGFKTTKRKISVHRKNCPELAKFTTQPRVEIDWDAPKGRAFKTEIRVIAADRPGLVKDLLEVVTNKTQNLNASVRQLNNATTLCVFEFTAKTVQEINSLLETVEKTPGVKKVSRS
ncbi:MAG: TGS domain-containing protein [archaeon]|nr:TGS domain-containing protein [archaeon]